MRINKDWNTEPYLICPLSVVYIFSCLSVSGQGIKSQLASKLTLVQVKCGYKSFEWQQNHLIYSFKWDTCVYPLCFRAIWYVWIFCYLYWTLCLAFNLFFSEVLSAPESIVFHFYLYTWTRQPTMSTPTEVKSFLYFCRNRRKLKVYTSFYDQWKTDKVCKMFLLFYLSLFIKKGGLKLCKSVVKCAVYCTHTLQWLISICWITVQYLFPRFCPEGT